MRSLLVEYGRTCRKYRPSYWVERLERDIDKCPCGGPFLITDVRYLNEVKWIIDRGGQVVYIGRAGFSAANQEELRSFGEILEWDWSMTGLWYADNVEGKPELAASFVEGLITGDMK